MMMRLIHLATAAAILLPLTASAQLYSNEKAESPRDQQLEFKFSSFVPGIDDDESTGAYRQIFDDDGMFMFRLGYDYQFWTAFGSLAAGYEIGYGGITGNGVNHNDATLKTEDETRLNIVPMAVSVTYAFDVGAVRYGFPLVPYVKAGLDYNIWWVSDGLDETATYCGDCVPGVDTEFQGSGDTWGWHAAIGIKLLLDFFAPKMAQSFDVEVGVNNSYFFAELNYSDVSDFGSDKSWQLGGLNALFGLAFEF